MAVRARLLPCFSGLGSSRFAWLIHGLTRVDFWRRLLLGNAAGSRLWQRCLGHWRRRGSRFLFFWAEDEPFGGGMSYRFTHRARTFPADRYPHLDGRAAVRSMDQSAWLLAFWTDCACYLPFSGPGRISSGHGSSETLDIRRAQETLFSNDRNGLRLIR